MKDYLRNLKIMPEPEAKKIFHENLVKSNIITEKMDTLQNGMNLLCKYTEEKEIGCFKLLELNKHWKVV